MTLTNQVLSNQTDLVKISPEILRWLTEVITEQLVE